MAIAHITLATRSVEKSCDFFINTLGWQQVVRPSSIHVDSAWLKVGPDQEIHLVHVDEFEPSRFESEFGRHIALDYPLDQFKSLKIRLKKHGATLIDPKRPTPFERFFFLDPNGYMFEIVDSDRLAETG